MPSIALLRLRSHGLTTPLIATHSAEVVRTLGAVQAQDYGQALWAVGSRLKAATRGSVENAIADRSIARSWVLRGTLHFVPAEDLRWMLQYLGPRIVASAASRYRQLELEKKLFAKAAKVVEEALTGGKQATREKLIQRLESNKIATGAQRGYHLLAYLALQGLICFGPRNGKHPTFVLLDEWLAPAGIPDRDTALSKLAANYFAGHGPATERDFAWWSGLTLRDARRAIESIASSLSRVSSDGTNYWHNTRALDKGEACGACLLAGFDEFLLGYKDRSHTLSAVHAHLVVPGKNGVFKPVMVKNGVVVGTWQQGIQNGVHGELQPFDALGTGARKRFESALERFADFNSN